jgi:predicted kinase
MLTIITGPPCSGKSTYARQHALPGDIIIDFDTIAQALGSPATHGHSNHIWKVTADARDAAITAAVRCHANGARVWIADSKPTTAKRAWYAAKGARFADLDATAAELHRRATAAGRPPRWHARIDQFAAAEPEPAPRTAW